MHALKGLTRLLTTAHKILLLETIVYVILNGALCIYRALSCFIFKMHLLTIHKKIFLQMLMSQASTKARQLLQVISCPSNAYFQIVFTLDGGFGFHPCILTFPI